MISPLDQAAVMQFDDYNPALVIEAVNALQPLGKEKALEQIEQYLETHDKSKHAYGLFWVLRVLFDVQPEQGFPPVGIGKPSLPPPAELGKLPRFPIAVVNDIPFLVVRGYYLGGLPEAVEVHVSYFRDYGTLRKQLMRPSASPDVVEKEFLQVWTAAYGNAHTAEALETIRRQVNRLAG